MSLIGLLAGLGLTITGHLPKVFHGRLYWKVGKSWGGVSLGCFIFCSKDSTDTLRQHEAGHGLQNIILGPFFPFLVGIPSALRYWLRSIKSQKNKYMFSLIIWLVGTFIGFGISLISIPSVGVPAEIHLGIWRVIIDMVGTLSIFYGAAVGCWLQFFEAPKYKDDKYVAYDAFWPEG